jgi:hypothetical protein
MKGKPCPETHNFKILGVQMGTFHLWISSLLLYHLSHANHVHLSNCKIFKVIVIKMFKFVSLWSS